MTIFEGVSRKTKSAIETLGYKRVSDLLRRHCTRNVRGLKLGDLEAYLRDLDNAMAPPPNADEWRELCANLSFFASSLQKMRAKAAEKQPQDDPYAKVYETAFGQTSGAGPENAQKRADAYAGKVFTGTYDTRTGQAVHTEMRDAAPEDDE